MKIIIKSIFAVFLSVSAANASDDFINKFHENAMQLLSEVSEPMFASEAEGSELEDKIIAGENLDFVYEIKVHAEAMIKKLGPDQSLVEVLSFANKILKENNNLMIQAAETYYEIRGECRAGDGSGKGISAKCERLNSLGSVLKRLGNCWDSSEQVWAACKNEG
ncbi:hypothetical protein [Agrobacterium tumefaciens]|uniref:Uncharacterized protein n=1 Tax=Agrobacterium tumefaciens TaxID=358 RepID=A0AA44F8K4_AGRTU|nr:hypothetical protein [Agrobacterium tumefaciens]NSL25115.1 hypothetical protein [Agrobacterium tumefaciens]NTB86768.1 hypothetical protein [Agrobacterium tumefaciens]NTC21097.1 hypothetical protein [Agrobacterium tumefaciens]NTC30645.1 hypothetical protein [Agrobacterium tumefaciens]NTC57693.1 hypothetical protein [Agrobacterium tumefaciens]